MTLKDDAAFMDLALALGRRGQGNAWPNPPVGCVVVSQTDAGPVIAGRGWTAPGGRPHAETQALGRAGKLAHGATLYVSLEPCAHHGVTPPCANAIIAAGIKRVVCALEDPDSRVAGQGFALLRAAGIAVEIGIGADQAARDLAGFLCKIRLGRPHVQLKLAISANSKIAAAGGRPVKITGPQAHTRVHQMRARSDAIMAGAGTVRADDPQLTCRLPGLEGASPVRVIVDSRLSLPVDAAMCRSAAEVPVWVFTGPDAPQEAEVRLAGRGVHIIRCAQTDGGADGRLDLPEILQVLGQRGITRLMVEGGAALAASLLRADLVDEAALFFSPDDIDEQGIDALEGMSPEAITLSDDFMLGSRQQFGQDTLFTYVRNR